MTETTATEASNDFWLYFKKERQAIETALDLSPQLTKDQLPDHFSKVLQQINQLDKQITEATTFIPSYDERQYAMQIRELTGFLDDTRTRLTPKPKFSFKSKLAKSKTKTVPQVQAEVPSESKNQTSASLENTISFANLENQVLTLSEQECRASASAAVDISLSHLSNCMIWLPKEGVKISTVHIKNIKKCIIVCGTVQGSILMYGLNDSVLVVNCHQFRMHDATNVDVLLQVSSRPIMEDSNRIRIGNNDQDQKSSVNYFDQMDDFNWLKQQASPHWTLLDKDRIDSLSLSLHNLLGLEQLELLPNSQ
ncbi:tubulin binding cofactor C-domain-containing protein [Absidia repens]|uniref:Tubulin binding cofactor C-domain-containing protein n=1 Tax=Absidia repens TaxID=90262 RepID=A0A1X2IAE3_9FUNG|nr:tubulin binding cofactor C-domain-containing protein [Absidia repens]